MPCGVARCSRTRRERALRPSILHADARHHAHPLRLDEDPALGVASRSDRCACAVVGAAEPVTVPAVLVHCSPHGRCRLPAPVGLARILPASRDLRHVTGGEDEQSGDEDGLGNAGFSVRGGLERFARRLGIRVQVEAVVPVGAPDQRQSVGSGPLQRVLDAPLQVLVQRGLGAGHVVVGDELLEDALVARLLEVRPHREHEPERVVVEAGPHGVVAAFGQRLVLVVGAAGRELGGREVQDPVMGTAGDHVHEPEQVLV